MLKLPQTDHKHRDVQDMFPMYEEIGHKIVPRQQIIESRHFKSTQNTNETQRMSRL